MRLLSSFHSIRFGLMVGIGGGVPSSHADIRLGDIVVSQPAETSGGVIQYDLGKALSGGQFQRTGMLNRPPKILLTALATLQAHHLTENSRILEFISNIHVTPHRAATLPAQPKRTVYTKQIMSMGHLIHVSIVTDPNSSYDLHEVTRNQLFTMD
jgi:hypothetical protein